MAGRGEDLHWKQHSPTPPLQSLGWPSLESGHLELRLKNTKTKQKNPKNFHLCKDKLSFVCFFFHLVSSGLWSVLPGSARNLRFHASFLSVPRTVPGSASSHLGRVSASQPPPPTPRRRRAGPAPRTRSQSVQQRPRGARLAVCSLPGAGRPGHSSRSAPRAPSRAALVPRNRPAPLGSALRQRPPGKRRAGAGRSEPRRASAAQRAALCTLHHPGHRLSGHWKTLGTTRQHLQQTAVGGRPACSHTTASLAEFGERQLSGHFARQHPLFGTTVQHCGTLDVFRKALAVWRHFTKLLTRFTGS